MADGATILITPADPAEAVSPPRHDDIIALLLIAMVTAIITCIGVMRWIARRELHRRKSGESPFLVAGLSATLFEPPSRWLALRGQSLQAVQSALAVHNPRACSWSDALAAPFEPRLFISPPVRGWILVMGCDLPDPADDVDECFKFLTDLSRKFGEVQFFSRNRAVGHHSWARLENGVVIRAYAWAGETSWNQGTQSDAERALKLYCLPYTTNSETLGIPDRERLALNTERVVRLAAAWSVDPTSVEGATLESKGIAGDLLHGKFH